MRLFVLPSAGTESVSRLTHQLLCQQLPIPALRPSALQLERDTDLPDVMQPRPERHKRTRLLILNLQRLCHHAPLTHGQQLVPDDLGNSRRVQEMTDQRVRVLHTAGTLAQPGMLAPKTGVQ
ncbi:hypothetical protein EDD98_4918 [Streptomyces sp. PanSC19]|nr:hypothetical protein EDD98_4918 [Streptomyces sp. PanSC19]